MDQEIKHRIIEAASTQFFKYGYSSISMDSISESLGMSKKTLYTIFTGKYDLLVHVMDRYKKNLSQSVDAILENEQYDFNTKLKEMLVCVGNSLSQVSPHFIIDVQETVPEVWESLKHYKMEAAYLRFNKLVTEGIKTGQIRKDVNKSVAVSLYACAIQSLFDDKFLVQLPDSIRKGLPNQPNALFDSIIEILFNGMMNSSTIKDSSLAFEKQEMI